MISSQLVSDLDNLFEIVIYYFLIEMMIDLSHRDKILMVSALMCTVTH